MLPLDDIRVRLEQKLLAALEAWDLEKKRLEEAMARAEEKERQYRETAEDVKHRLEALDLVAAMMSEPAAGTAIERAAPVVEKQLAIAGQTPAADMRMHATSRPLFTPRERHSLSILP